MFLSPGKHSDGEDAAVIYSASDLAAAARCEYALLRRFDGLLGRGPKAVVDDDLLARTAELGDTHEQRHLEQLAASPVQRRENWPALPRARSFCPVNSTDSWRVCSLLPNTRSDSSGRPK
ncbi:hypothetical protein A7G45_29345 [Mycolicibacterium llatzerense]|nr:hypothetical protein [Mycolicibacterium llatzerense]MCT7366974.1 hypothetical protein [Mycolicibacterium llatzerense]